MCVKYLIERCWQLILRYGRMTVGTFKWNDYVAICMRMMFTRSQKFVRFTDLSPYH
ncbi:hypothetical protein AHAS_Ahas07G0041600 [Arachis hypogaea]